MDSETRAGFEFNRPTIIALLYLVGIVTALPTFLAAILAYVWRGEPGEGWEQSHYRFHIRSFWLMIVVACIGAVTLVIGVGFFILAAIGIWLAVRSIVALAAAQRREPIKNVETWLW